MNGLCSVTNIDVNLTLLVILCKFLIPVVVEVATPLHWAHHPRHLNALDPKGHHEP